MQAQCLAPPSVQFSGYKKRSLKKLVSKPSASGFETRRKRKRNEVNVRRLRRTQRNEVSSDAAVGVFNGEGPPVPIPNTEVKLTSAENTCLATDWKDRSTPTQEL